MMRLIDWDTEVSAFIFKSELKKMFYKWVEGTVVCIANAKVLESQKVTPLTFFSFIVHLPKIGVLSGILIYSV